MSDTKLKEDLLNIKRFIELGSAVESGAIVLNNLIQDTELASTEQGTTRIFGEVDRFAALVDELKATKKLVVEALPLLW